MSVVIGAPIQSYNKWMCAKCCSERKDFVHDCTSHAKKKVPPSDCTSTHGFQDSRVYHTVSLAIFCLVVLRKKGNLLLIKKEILTDFFFYLMQPSYSLLCNYGCFFCIRFSSFRCRSPPIQDFSLKNLNKWRRRHEAKKQRTRFC